MAMTEAPTGYIRLNIKDTELQFHIKKSARLGKLMDAYSARLGLQSSQIRFMVNGKCIIDAKLHVLATKVQRLTGLKRSKGFIGLQNHASPVHYRNLRIQRLK